MAVTTQEIKMLGCDVEGCEVKAPSVDGKLPAKFQAGSVRIDTLDGESVGWIACRETHIGKAVVAARAKALAEQASGVEGTAPEDAGDQPASDDVEEDFDTSEAPEAPEYANA